MVWANPLPKRHMIFERSLAAQVLQAKGGCTNKDRLNPRINVFVNIQSTAHIDTKILKSMIN